MLARHIPAQTGAEAARVVRALGSHRYVAGGLHAIHAFVFAALAGGDGTEASNSPLAEACLWAKATLADPSIEQDSKDPRLFRQASNEELALALEGFWVPSEAADRAHERLAATAHRLGLEIPLHEPFDEAVENDMHPVLIDAGWQLLTLAELDPVRHRGGILAYGEPVLFEAARFEEENAIPARVPLQELPALGLAELLRATGADGELLEPLVLWTLGDEAYHDYLLRGVLKAAKVTTA